MITVCPVCSRSVVAHWPEFWPYRRGEAFYCSQNCYDISLTRDLNMLHDAARRRRGLKMARMKKDGTPAKRPGPKAKTIIETPECGIMEVEIPEKVPTVKVDGPLKIETPEAGKVEVVPVLPEIMQPASYEGMVIREVEGMFGRYRYSDIGSAEYIDFESTDRLDTLSFTVDQWKRFREEQVKAARVLGVKL